MKTLTSCSSKVIVDKYRDKGSVSPNEFLLIRPEICSLRSQKVGNLGFLHLISVQHKAIYPVTSFSSKNQADLETSETQIQETYQSETVNVKFQLQKECMFGEQFLIVGDDPMFGLWDPSSAIPLDWSDGHVWTVELNVPVGKAIQFKFILKESTGNILWQPGPNRSFQTWETKNTITVCEDWDNAEFQKIIDEEQLANQNDQPVISSEMLIVAKNLTDPKDQLTSCVNEGSAITEINTSPAEKLIAEPRKEQIVADNIALSQENPKAIVADNISYSTEDPIVNASRTTDPKEESTAILKESIIAEDILGNNGRAPTVESPGSTDVEENLINHEVPLLVPGLTPLSTVPTEEPTVESPGNTDVEEKLINHEVPLLVPGLTPLSTVPTEEASQDENEKRILVDASVGAFDSTKDHLPELDEKQEPDGDPPQEATIEMFNGEEKQLHNESKQKPHVQKIEELPNSESIDNAVLKKDIQWGRRTLQKFLINLGLL